MLGDRLRNLRIWKKVTQEDMAGLLHVKRQTYSAYERNVSLPDIPTLIVLSDFFGVSVEYLICDQVKGKSTEDQGDQVIQNTLKDTGLLDADGTLSPKGKEVISDFIAKNAEMLKKLIKDAK